MTNFVKKNQDVILIAFVIAVIYFAFFNDGKALFSKLAPASNGNGGNGNGNGNGEGEASAYALDKYPQKDRNYLDWWGASMGQW